MTEQPNRSDALAVLERHWRSRERYTSPNAETYPWLWLWDSCFHALVWAEVGDARCVQELSSVFAYQAEDGFVPHMGYAPEPEAAGELWGRQGASVITQPPMYGHTARELTRRGFRLSDELIAAVREACAFLWERRRAENGLISVVHPWEGGTDDSPRWDGWCEGPFDRFGRWRERKLELVQALRLTPGGTAVGSDAFVVQPAGFNALCTFNFAELAALTDDPQWRRRSDELVDALDERWDPRRETWTDAADNPPASTTVRTLDALLGVLVTRRDDARESVWRQLFDERAYGADFGPCGVHRGEPSFDPGAYWRGAAWPQLNYLFWVAATRQGRHEEAEKLARQTTEAAAMTGHAEYWHPLDGQPGGAAPQSWSTLWLLMRRDAASTRRAALRSVYPHDVADALAEEVERRLDRPGERAVAPTRWDERDAWLITYPDQFGRDGEPPLRTLEAFFSGRLAPWLNGLHVTPFAPWTSDEGYSIVDYLQVDERYGTWADVEALARRHRLMLDAVINHLSAQSRWFRGFLEGDERDRGFFRTADPKADLSAVARPRTSPLLTRFDAAEEPRWVWTTFSPDQVDLDYANPRVLLAVLDVLLAYADRGAQALRLDAIAYLWKQEGTSCIHLPETHAIVAFLRDALTAVYPNLVVITETNVPHEENFAYFGSASVPQAHAVYQFPLAPLTLHALLSGDARLLRDWAADLAPPRADTTFLNFLASHDGVGLRPAEGLLDDDAVELLVAATRSSGGEVSMRELPDGTSSPYELNATWYSLLGAQRDEDVALARHLASHAIMLALQGIPLLYVHSLFATANDREAFARTGQARSLNRRRFDDVADLQRRLDDPTSRAGRTWQGLRTMLAWRAATPAFHPASGQRVLPADRRVFALERTAANGERARVYVNVSAETVVMDDPLDQAWSAFDGDAMTEKEIRLEPYGCRWLRGSAVGESRERLTDLR
ncbi:MAG: MGH1-like glycoside hydrolase domain-containing protein [Egibacteraceae bacterium]